jgi:hypothetical protein
VTHQARRTPSCRQLFFHHLVASCLVAALSAEGPLSATIPLKETIMAESEFNAPVLVVLGPDRTVRVVSNAAEAIACLSSIYWPKAGKQRWREAAHVCKQAFRGYRSEENARLAFIAAAQAAGVLGGGHCHSAGSTLASVV